MNSPKVSVIIPVYNVEPYIEECLKSLFEQTLEDMEFIFVDDCSQDNSVSIIETTLQKYPQRKLQTKIIRLSRNGGVANARNVGLKNATGLYIGWMDPDDWIDINMFNIMYERAISQDFDIVWIDYYQCTNESKILIEQSCNDDPKVCTDSFLKGDGKLVSGLPFKLAKRECYSTIEFTPGMNICEDWYASLLLFSGAKRVSHIREGLYYYRYDSTTSMSSIKDKEKVIKGKKEILYNFRKGVEIVMKSDHSSYTQEGLEFAKLHIRQMTLNLYGYKAWKNCYPESYNFDILNLPIHQKINYWFLRRGIVFPFYVLKYLSILKNGYKIR